MIDPRERESETERETFLHRLIYQTTMSTSMYDAIKQDNINGLCHGKFYQRQHETGHNL